MNKKILTSLVLTMSMALSTSVLAAGGAKDDKKGGDIRGVEKARENAAKAAGKANGERTMKDIKNETVKSLEDALSTAKGLKTFQGAEIGSAEEIFNRIGNVDIIKTLVEEGIKSKSAENQEIASAIIHLNSKKLTQDNSLEVTATNTLAQAISKTGQMFEKSTDAEFKKQRENVLSLSKAIKESANLEAAIAKAAERRGMSYDEFVKLLKKCSDLKA